jgi:hypothetical protein
MASSDLSTFNFDARENVALFFHRPHPVYWVAVNTLVLALMLWLAAWAIDPNWHPSGLRGKSGWVIGLLVLLPVTIRGIVLAIGIGCAAESIYRQTWRTYDRRPGFVLGPTGIADLNPWHPQAFAWREVHQVSRHIIINRFRRQRETLLTLVFRAPGKPRFGIPPCWWNRLPALVTDRRISIVPSQLGLTEAEVLAVVERFAGKIPVTNYVVD